jgi:carboxypeptidase PM20D1
VLHVLHVLHAAAAVTILHAGVAQNVLPQTANVSINFRLLPSSTPADALRYIQQWLGPNAAHATVSLKPTETSPSLVADSKGLAFKIVKEAVQQSWRFSEAAGVNYNGVGVPVLSYLVPGGTDSKHYQNLTNTILRFVPFSLTPELMSTIHATNERIAVADFQRLLCTYRTGLMLAGGGEQMQCSQPNSATSK